MFTMGARATSVNPAFAIALPCASNTVTPGVIVASESTTKSLAEIFSAETAVPVVVLKVTVGEASPGTVAVAEFGVFAAVPRAHRAPAPRIPPEEGAGAETLPPALLPERGGWLPQCPVARW